VVEPNRGQLVELARLVDCGDLRPIIHRVFPLGAAREAFERNLDPARSGKIVIDVDGEKTQLLKKGPDSAHV
jgi:NADPH:quinone reductase-like Zn-dependent oxidoreductase